MWKRENYASHEIVTFYTEQEYKELEEKLAKCKEILYNIYKAFDTCTPIENIEDYIEDEALMEEFFRKRDEEWNARSVG